MITGREMAKRGLKVKLKHKKLCLKRNEME